MLDSITLFTIIFYASILVPIFGIFSLAQSYSIGKENFVLNYLGPFYILFVFLLIAFRPIGVDGFTDTAMYMEWFSKSKLNNQIQTKDIGFGMLIFLTSKIVSVRVFFVICTLMSFGTIYYISRIVAGKFWFLFFLGEMISLYFWNHQVFTIRQGIASLFFLAGLFQKRFHMTLLLCLLAISFHKSFLLPFFCYFLITIFNKTNFYIALWVFSIPISYFYGHEIGAFLSNILPEETRRYYFPNTADTLIFENFRWDVILYSSIFIILPLFYKIKDEKYLNFYNLYVLTNLFTILLIWPTDRFIHRFAYLSWFLSPVIIYYPLFQNKNLISFYKYFKTIIVFYILIVVYLSLKVYKQNFKFVPDQTVSHQLK